MIGIEESLLRLFLAVVFGGLVGWERETHDRPAGFRTHILVSIGSALLMMISIRMVYLFPETEADPGRIAAQVVSGMGFLGAGTIIREGLSVKGLTTAASLWSIAAIGLAVGGGYFDIAFLATLLVLTTLYLLSRLELNIDTTRRKKLLCRVNNKPGVLGEIGVSLGAMGINIINVYMEREIEEGKITIEFDLELPRKVEIGNINEKILRIDGITEINWQSL